jgi:hypothetical protein
MDSSIVKIQGVTRQFGDMKALDNIDFNVELTFLSTARWTQMVRTW